MNNTRFRHQPQRLKRSYENLIPRAALLARTTGWGERRETHSTADSWGGPWTKATEALHGEHGYEMYSLVPYRAPTWRAGLYLGIGSFFETTNTEGYVRCELCRSTDYGAHQLALAQAYRALIERPIRTPHISQCRNMFLPALGSQYWQ